MEKVGLASPERVGRGGFPSAEERVSSVLASEATADSGGYSHYLPVLMFYLRCSKIPSASSKVK